MKKIEIWWNIKKSHIENWVKIIDEFDLKESSIVENKFKKFVEKGKINKKDKAQIDDLSKEEIEELNSFTNKERLEIYNLIQKKWVSTKQK